MCVYYYFKASLPSFRIVLPTGFLSREPYQFTTLTAIRCPERDTINVVHRLYLEKIFARPIISSGTCCQSSKEYAS